MTRLLLVVLFAASSAASAIVIRHDVADSEYRVAASEFPALADMPGQGHGVLVTPQWVVTAAHTIPMHSELRQVDINGIARDVELVVVHEGYKTPPGELLDQALATGDWILTVMEMASSDDIALIKLSEAVTDVSPVTIRSTGDERGRIVKILGKGATGTGDSGHAPHGPNRTELRRAFNTVTSAHERWFCYVFDEPSSSLPLEGKTGSGDSGGPVLVQIDDEWVLVGLASWGFILGDVRVTPPGLYGQLTCNIRLSHYIEWIREVISGPTVAESGDSLEPAPLPGRACSGMPGADR